VVALTRLWDLYRIAVGQIVEALVGEKADQQVSHFFWALHGYQVIGVLKTGEYGARDCGRQIANE
jgi:hypothetical protein